MIPHSRRCVDNPLLRTVDCVSTLSIGNRNSARRVADSPQKGEVLVCSTETEVRKKAKKPGCAPGFGANWGLPLCERKANRRSKDCAHLMAEKDHDAFLKAPIQAVIVAEKDARSKLQGVPRTPCQIAAMRL
jgi:hypothetical protein